MPAPVGRDLEPLRDQLVPWLASQLPDATDVEIGPLTGPGATGFSSDTLIFELFYRAGGVASRRGLVIRIKPTGFQIFPEYDLSAQYAIMAALADTDIPVPAMLWEEPTGDVIGDPFYVMEKIEGKCPADNPPYTAEGWLKEMEPGEQARLWNGYVEVLAAIHRLDPHELGLGFLARPDRGADPIDQELQFYQDFYRWAWGEEGEHPVVEPALAWLRANKPAVPEKLCLVWGDARIGNMIFQDSRCVAVIDWEMARLGDPMMDLAWGLFLDRYHTVGNMQAQLPGFPSHAETIALYQELTERSTDGLDYYGILAGMRFSVILIRLARQLKYYEFMPEDANFEIDNPVCNLHRKDLEAIGVL